MCGRARCCLSGDQIRRAVDKRQRTSSSKGGSSSSSSNSSNSGPPQPPEEVHQKENLRPGNQCLVVDHSHNLVQSIWGMVPSYHSSSEPVDHFKLFNIRIETALEKFKRVLEKKRVVIVFDGYYEWKSEIGSKGSGAKQPYYVHRQTLEESEENPPLLMAGLYDEWNGIHSFSLLTCAPCSTLLSLHDRQPVFLNEETVEAWLNPATNIATLLTTLQSEQYRESFSSMVAVHPVSKKMTNMEYQVE